MARVPLSIVPDTQVISTPPDDYQHIASSPAEFGGLIGGAEQKLGAEGEQAANNVTQIALAQQSRFNQITGDNAMNQFMDEGDKLTFGVPGDPNSPGLFNLKGGAALEQGPQVVTSLGKLRETIKNGLQNDAQKLQFDEQSRRYFQYKQGDISRHLSAQADVYGRAVNNATIDTAAAHAGYNYNDDEKIAHSLADAAGAATKNVGLATLGPAGTPSKVNPVILENEQRKVYGEVIQRSVMGALAADPNGGGALRGQQILEKFGGLIDPDLRATLTTHVKGAGEQAGVAGGIATVMGTAPGAAFAAPTKPSAPIEPDAKVRAGAVRDGLIQRGMDPDTATAFAANALHESAANPNTGTGDGGASHGLFMWNGTRLAEYHSIYGHSPDNAPLAEQLDFVVHELNASEAPARDQIAQAQGPAAKAAAISQAYLRPKDEVPEMQRRAATAVQLAGGDTGVQSGDTGVQSAAGGGQAPAGSTHVPQVFGWEQQKMAQARQYATQQFPNSPRLQKELVDGVWSEIQQTNLLQAKYNADVEKQRREASQQIHSNIIMTLADDPTKFDPKVLGQKDQAGNFILTPEQQENVIRFAHEQMKEHGIDDTAPYGSGYAKAYANIFAPSDDPNKINDLNDILKRGAPGGDLSGAGVQKLAGIFTASRKNPDQLAVSRTESAMLQYAKGKLSFEQDMGPIKIRDPKGEAIFNAQFVPKFESGLAAAAATGDPQKVWEYLKQENVDKIMQGLRSQADMAKDRLLATGQLTPADVEKPGTPLPPPPTLRTPEGKPMTHIDPLGWRDALANVPVRGDADRTPWTHAAWAKALTMLAEDPTKENMEEFDARFGIQGFKAEDLLRTMTTPRSAAAPRAVRPSDAMPGGLFAPAMGVP